MTAAKRAKNERGVAILITIFALVLLSAVAAAMIFLSSTDTDINRNYRSGQSTYFAAKGGIERVRARMVPNLNDLTGANIPQILPNLSSAGSVLYVLNSDASIDPTDSSSTYYDTELCHEFPLLYGMTASPTPGLRCGSGLTTGSAVSKITDTLNSGTVNDLSNTGYKWVRITMKTNVSVADGSSTSTCTSNCPGWVNGTSGNSATTDQHNQVCYDGVHEFVAGDYGAVDCITQVGTTPNPYSPVYVLTALAVDNSMASTVANPTRRMAQMEVAVMPPVSTQGAISSQDFVQLNGSLSVNGYDSCSCVCTTTGTGSNAVTTCTDRPGYTCDKTKWGIYSASGVADPNSSETIIGGQMNNAYDPPSSIAADQPWPYDIPQLIDYFKSGAINTSTTAPYSYNCTPPDYTATPVTDGNCSTHSGQTYGSLPAGVLDKNGTWTAPLDPTQPPPDNAYYVPGDLKLTANSTGSGVLIVDGNLEINGGLQWYGLILVRGTVSFTGGGSQTTNIYGAVLAGKQSYVDLSCTATPTNDCTTVGGSASINLDLCALPQGGKNKAPRVISYRELEY